MEVDDGHVEMEIELVSSVKLIRKFLISTNYPQKPENVCKCVKFFINFITFISARRGHPIRGGNPPQCILGEALDALYRPQERLIEVCNQSDL